MVQSQFSGSLYNSLTSPYISSTAIFLLLLGSRALNFWSKSNDIILFIWAEDLCIHDPRTSAAAPYAYGRSMFPFSSWYFEKTTARKSSSVAAVLLIPFSSSCVGFILRSSQPTIPWSGSPSAENFSCVPLLESRTAETAYVKIINFILSNDYKNIV